MNFVPGRPRWWQWPAILSLDAVVVTVTWQALLARIVAAPLAGYHAALLASSVWLSYSADRWIEGWRLSEETVRTQRHYFAIHWRWPLLVLWTGVLGISVASALHFFDAREWAGSLVMLVPALLYLLSHQFLHRDHPMRIPKEICVAAILTGGAAVYPVVLAPERAADLIAPAALFCALALADLLLISMWEREVDVVQHQTSLALRYQPGPAVARALLLALFLSGLALAYVRRGAARRAGECGALSAALMAVLSAVQPRLGRERARSLIDLTLLTPFLALLIP